jgi:acetyltransferase-like isoleucine patch superfamily enzyme
MKNAWRSIERCLTISELAADRLRTVLLRLRGCQVGPKARVGRGVRVDRPWTVCVGARCHLEADVWLKVVEDGARLTMGESVFLGRGVEIDVRVSVVLGSHVLVAPGVFITDHTHNARAGQLIDAQGVVDRPVVIDEDVWLGVGSVVLPGVHIGRGSIVGAGAVVTRDIPAGSVVAGVPARVLRLRV